MAENEETKATDKKVAKGPGLMTMIKAVAFVSVIVLLQIAAASMIIPTAEETAVIAGELAAANLEEDAAVASKETDSEAEDSLLAVGDMSEVFVGTFHVLSQNANTGGSTNVSFDLYATVLADEESDFFDLFAANEQRIREQVLVTLRGTEMTDLTDPTFGLIKRRLLEKVNRTLGKPLLRQAIISKFSFEER